MTFQLRTLVCSLLLLCSIAQSNAEDGVTDTAIKIGQSVGVTGTVAGPVKEMNEGANLYFSQINKQGGVYGRKVEMIVLDDKFDPALTKANAETLINREKVFAMFLGRGTPHNQGILPLLEEHKVPHLAPSTGATVFHTPVHKWLFNVRASYHAEIFEVLKHLALIGHKSIGLLHVDDAFGKDGLEGFNKAMAQSNLTPAGITKFDRVKPDYAIAASDVIKAAPSAVLIISSAKNTIEVIKKIREQGGTMQLATLSNNSSESFVKDLGPQGVGVMVSQVTPSPFSRSTSIVQEFHKAAAENKTIISYASLEGYINAKVLVEGLKRAGKGLTRSGFVKALESMKNEDMGGVSVSYGPNDHSGSKFVELTMISRDGKFLR